MKRLSLIATMLTMVLIGFSAATWADEEIVITLVGVVLAPQASGMVSIQDNPTGPDRMKLKIAGLPPNTRMTVFLTEDQTPGGLPAQLLGEFTTDGEGEGELELVTEIVNAFASANPAFDTDRDGVTRNMGDFPDRLSNGALTIPLNWFRGYVAVGTGNVFGPDEDTPGGGPVFISTPALP